MFKTTLDRYQFVLIILTAISPIFLCTPSYAEISISITQQDDESTSVNKTEKEDESEKDKIFTLKIKTDNLENKPQPIKRASDSIEYLKKTAKFSNLDDVTIKFSNIKQSPYTTEIAKFFNSQMFKVIVRQTHKLIFENCDLTDTFFSIFDQLKRNPIELSITGCTYTLLDIKRLTKFTSTQEIKTKKPKRKGFKKCKKKQKLNVSTSSLKSNLQTFIFDDSVQHSSETSLEAEALVHVFSRHPYIEKLKVTCNDLYKLRLALIFKLLSNLTHINIKGVFYNTDDLVYASLNTKKLQVLHIAASLFMPGSNTFTTQFVGLSDLRTFEMSTIKSTSKNRPLPTITDDELYNICNELPAISEKPPHILQKAFVETLIDKSPRLDLCIFKKMHIETDAIDILFTHEKLGVQCDKKYRTFYNRRHPKTNSRQTLCLSRDSGSVKPGRNRSISSPTDASPKQERRGGIGGLTSISYEHLT